MKMKEKRGKGAAGTDKHRLNMQQEAKVCTAEPKALEPEEWFFGKFTRNDAEKHLMQPFIDRGSFLVRPSQSKCGDFSLSIRDKNRIRHCRIRRLTTGGFIVTARGQSFTVDNILTLIDYFHRKPRPLVIKL